MSTAWEKRMPLRRQVCLSFVLLLGVAVIAQRPTLRERVAVERADVALTVNADGPPLPFARILEETDFVVRAVLGQAVGHLSEDGRDVYTTYELVNPHVSFQATTAKSLAPGVTEVITLTQRGGTVRIDGYAASVLYDDGAKLSSGMDVVALLHDDKGKRWVAGGGYGIFEVRDSKIMPLVNRPGDHQRYAGVNADRFLAEVLALRGQFQAK